MRTSEMLSRRWTASLILPILLLSGGCTHMMEQPVHEIDLPSVGNKIDLPVRLVLTDEFRTAQWTKSAMGDTWIVPLGENLVHDAKRVARNVFVAPIIPDDGAYRGDLGRARYRLTPKMLFSEQSFGVTAFSEAKTSIGLEWSLADESGRQVWVESVKGVGVGIGGNVFTGKKHQKLRLQKALQDLFTKSQDAMLASATLRQLK
jgi:hypothetical protein